jgi:hypothetical protein
MAFVPADLQTALTKIFNDMNNISNGGDAYCAEQMASELKKFTLTGQVTTSDSGTTPAGSYKGTGKGTMTIDADSLADSLENTFSAKYNNDDLADHIATDIHNACIADDIVEITSSGTVTLSSGGTSPFSGPGEGNFTGTKETIASALKACFAAMNNMTTGGNEYYAAQLATAYNTYLTAGKINVSLKEPFSSGSGSGKIA